MHYKYLQNVAVLLISVLLTLISAVAAADHLPPQSVLRIGGAEYGSGIYRNATSLARVYHNESVATRSSVSHEHKFGVAMSSAGTIANLRDLASGRLEFGYANARLAESVFRDPAGHGLDKSVNRLRLIASMQPSVVQIIAPKISGRTTIDRLHGKRISYGMPDAGHRQLVEPLLRMNGIDTDELQKFHFPLSLGVKKLAAGDLDALITVDQIPNLIIKDLLESGEYELLSLDESAIRTYMASSPLSKFTLLTQFPYANIEAPFVGVSLETYLLSQDTVSPAIVGPVLDHLLATAKTDLSGAPAEDPLQMLRLAGIESSIPMHDACTSKIAQTLSAEISGAADEAENTTLVESVEH